jgi:hypothetical protein
MLHPRVKSYLTQASGTFLRWLPTGVSTCLDKGATGMISQVSIPDIAAHIPFGCPTAGWNHHKVTACLIVEKTQCGKGL